MAGSVGFAERIRAVALLVISASLGLFVPASVEANDTQPAPATTQAVTAPASAAAPVATQPPAIGRPAIEHTGKPVGFTTDDNLVIAGTWYGPSRKGESAPVVILLHMYQGSRSDFTPLVPALLRAGFAVLAVDLRGHGESVGPPAMKLAERVAQRDRELFANMHRDVAAAYQWIRAQSDVDLARFALVGASVGCSVALDYAARDRSVDAVVCLTPGASYLGLDAVESLRKYGDRPLLILVSQAERASVDPIKHAAAKATLQVVPGPAPGQNEISLHGTRMLGKALGVEDQIAQFIQSAVGPFSNERVVASIKGKVYYEPRSSQAKRLVPENLRWFTSAAEAESRGLRPPARKKPASPSTPPAE